MITIPPLPPARGFEGDEGGKKPGRAELHPRYEDITQDGRLVLTSLMPGVGMAVWGALLSKMPALEAFREQGVLPILRRLVLLEGEPGPFSVHVPLSYEGTWRLAREKGGERLFVNMWVRAFAPIASTFGPPLPRDAPRVLAGSVFVEHVVTRPFSPPDARKVTRLDVPGFPAVPEDEHVFEPTEDLVAGRALAPADEVAFGMMHTDSNQHVNSLVYPRLFEEALVRHRPDGAPATLLARALEIRWRKPFFAGDRARIALALAHDGDRAFDARGTFAPAASPDRPSCAIAMVLRPS